LFNDPNSVSQAVRSGFRSLRALVVGDLILDRYLWGNVDRISPEAPVPVLRLDHETKAAGGAANVAANLSALGCEVSAIGLLGVDENGYQLLELLHSFHIETGGILKSPNRPTIAKTRIIGGRQQMLRLDIEEAGGLSSQLKRDLLAEVDQRIQGSCAVVLSDYGKGLLSEPVCRAIISRARALSVPTFVDPKALVFDKYAACTLISPNRLELATATATGSADLETLLQKGQRLRSELEIGHMMVTLGELGITLLDATGVHRFPALARDVFDVSGAGDTVVATVAAATAAGLGLHDAIRLANLAAGTVISKVGTVPITREELLASLTSDEGAAEKICTSAALLQRVVRWRAAGQRIVFTNGCFDLLHVGHLALLEHAKRLGDCLVVALNTDRSIRTLKGIGRPIISEESRAKLVAALPCVDAVVLFDEDTPLNLIGAVRPNVLVKGGDYTEDEVVGAREIKSWGGQVRLVPLVEGLSTTAILKRALLSSSQPPEGLIQ
jgi:D-beta-D-heptose 7-phosphate kinase / D-beta-D-heptose 1-phosphate adenosyltransferase